MSGQKVMAAMSGGVDSSVTALLLARQGYEVCGGTLLLWQGENPQEQSGCCALSEVEDARRVCAHLGVEHYTFNLKDVFCREVIDRFAEGYRRGETPNPCVDCNRSVKFTRLFEKASLLDCEFLATGHYARIEREEGSGRWLLRRGADPDKDQSYVLYVLSQETLAHTLFPLGELTKREVRELAAAEGFPTASKSESQDICFVPDGDYAAFLERRLGAVSPPGHFLSRTGEVLGEHRGMLRYTLGQRRGLGVSAAHRLFVVEKDLSRNAVILGDECDLYARRMPVSAVNWVSAPPISASLRARVKSRYRQEAQPAWLHPAPGGVLVEFDAPQRALTPGQAAVFYDEESGEYLLGGGTISAMPADAAQPHPEGESMRENLHAVRVRHCSKEEA